MARARTFEINLGWLLGWLLDNFLRAKLKEFEDEIKGQLPITFYFNTRYVNGRIILDEVDFPEF